MQFGFKENSSTITCAHLLAETIEYYIGNNTDCFMLLSDVLEEFDIIEYLRSFEF